MALCDDLEAKLGVAQAVEGRLLEAVVGQVVGIVPSKSIQQ